MPRSEDLIKLADELATIGDRLWEISTASLVEQVSPFIHAARIEIDKAVPRVNTAIGSAVRNERAKAHAEIEAAIRNETSPPEKEQR